MSSSARAVRWVRRHPKASGVLAVLVTIGAVFGGDEEKPETEPAARPFVALPGPAPTTARTTPARTTPAPPSPAPTPTPTRARVPVRTTAAPVPVATRTTQAPRPVAAPALSCTASVTNTAPRKGSTTTVVVRTQPGAEATATAYYKTTSTSHDSVAGSTGTARIPFNIGGATSGYRVDVEVVVTKGAGTGTCSTFFVPR